MRGVLQVLRRELHHMLHAIANLHTDNGIHGYGLARAHTEEGSDR
jgi:hypothetical protein